MKEGGGLFDKVSSTVKSANPLGSLKTAAKGVATGKVAGLAGKATGLVGAAAGAAANPAGLAAQLKEKAEKEAAEAALKAAGLSPAQIALAQRGSDSMGGLSKTKDALTGFAGKASLFFAGLWAGMKERWLMITVIVLAIGILIIGIAYAKKRMATPESTDTKAAALAATTGKEGFQAAEVAPAVASSDIGNSLGKADTAPAAPEDELTFLNAQAKTIKQAGYLGPPSGGKFNPEEATGQALKAGFRAFVLQIDSVKGDMDKTAFPDGAGFPTLLYRGDDGALISANSGSIETVAKTIAALAFRPEVPDYTMPVILYLHVLAAPSPVRAQEQYIRFLARIARALNPLAPFHLGSTPMGVFHRQKRERELLGMPMKALEGQVIILSNADTTLFRTPLPGGKRYDPADDLDYWVNMRVYLENEDDVQGIAKISEKGTAAGGGPAAVVLSLSEISNLGAAKRDTFATRGKGRFVIAMPGALTNPAPAQLDRALTDLGVNMVPLDIFGVPLEESKKLVENYGGVAYKSKPAALRVHAAAPGGKA
jgi:hypothetical protein